MFSSTDVGSIGVCPGAGNITKLAAKLVLCAAGRAAATTAAITALRDLQCCLLLLVLLTF